MVQLNYSQIWYKIHHFRKKFGDISKKMTKDEAIELFGSLPRMSVAMEITRQTLYNWPDELPVQKADQVRGAWVRVRANERERQEAILFGLGGDL